MGQQQQEKPPKGSSVLTQTLINKMMPSQSVNCQYSFNKTVLPWATGNYFSLFSVLFHWINMHIFVKIINYCVLPVEKLYY